MKLFPAWIAGIAATRLSPPAARTGRSRWPADGQSTLSPEVAPEAPASYVNRHYGPNDPVADALRFIWPCPCGHQPVLSFDVADADVPAQEHSRGTGEVQLQAQARHFIHCEACNRQGRPGEMPWQAVVEWNRTFPDTRRAMAEFPFFVLDGLSLREARSKLVGVRADLETRRARAKLKARAGQEVGKRYRERIDAYLRWTIVAQALASAHGRVQQRQEQDWEAVARFSARRGHLMTAPIAAATAGAAEAADAAQAEDEHGGSAP